MPKTTNIHNNPNTEIFSDERNEFGLFQFKSEFIQSMFQKREDQYTKMRDLKNAFDKQELIIKMINDVEHQYQKRMQQLNNIKIAFDNQELVCKMRNDDKREYQTRLQQLYHLQKNAQVEFRNAEHEYVKCTKSSLYGPDGIEISAPQTINLATIVLKNQFEILRRYHNKLRLYQEQQIEEEKYQAKCLLDEQKRQDEVQAKWLLDEQIRQEEVYTRLLNEAKEQWLLDEQIRQDKAKAEPETKEQLLLNEAEAQTKWFSDAKWLDEQKRQDKAYEEWFSNIYSRNPVFGDEVDSDDEYSSDSDQFTIINANNYPNS